MNFQTNNIIFIRFVGVGKTAITIMMNFKKIFSNDFVETTFDELRKNGHTKYNLDAALRCIKIILEYVDTKIIECNLNATNDDLFYYCRSYIIDKYDTFCLYKFVPPFDNVHFNQICYECDSVRKSKYSPNDTFVTLFRICYEHQNKLMNEKIPVMINQKLCWVKHPLN